MIGCWSFSGTSTYQVQYRVLKKYMTIGVLGPIESDRTDSGKSVLHYTLHSSVVIM